MKRVRFLTTNAFLLKVIEISPNAKKRSAADLKLLILHTWPTFLRSSKTDFVEEVTKEFLAADIPL